MAANSQLQREIGQSRPFRSARQEAVVALLRTADVVRDRFEQLFGAHGITLQQYNALRIIRGAQPKPLPTMEIAERMIERAPGITRLVDRLAEKGLVDRSRSRNDRRCVFCSLTAKGEELLKRLDDPVDSMDETALGKLGDSEVKGLIRILNKIRAESG